MEEQKLDNKRKTILIIIAVLTLTIGLSLAYIIAQLQDEGRGNASVVSDTVDILRFEVDKDINLNPTQFNVVEGGDNLSDTAVGSAILRANSTDNNATYNYYVYFLINSNNYVYTTEEHTPEIVLTITDPTGSPVTSVEGLTYVESLGGFDITTKSGLYNIAESYEITSTSSTVDTVQDWTFTVSFINLDTNQHENGGKTLEAEVILSREPRYTLANYIIENVYVEDGVNNLYYHDGMGTYTNAELEAGDNSYRFSGGDYEISAAYQGTYSQIYGDIIKCYCAGIEDPTFGISCSDNIYYTLGYDTNNTEYATLGEALDQAVSDGYLTRDNVKNYICFGSTDTLCPSENIYRIIGVFDGNVKLIQNNPANKVQLGTDGEYSNYDYDLSLFPTYKGILGMNNNAGIYRWSTTNYDTYLETGYYNVWSYSKLNTINLNINYLKYLDNWESSIQYTNWYIGGIDENVINDGNYSIRHNVKSIYDAELGNGKVTMTPFEPYEAKIGLIYVSDYLYASNPEYWGEISDFNSSEIMSESYLDLGYGIIDWTLSRYTNEPNMIFTIHLGVSIGGSGQNGMTPFVRPVFYLNSSALYSSGDGSIDNPYRIEI